MDEDSIVYYQFFFELAPFCLVLEGRQEHAFRVKVRFLGRNPFLPCVVRRGAVLLLGVFLGSGSVVLGYEV